MPKRFLVLPQIELRPNPDGRFAEIQFLEVQIKYRSSNGMPEDTAASHLIHDYQLVDEVESLHGIQRPM
jgi:hypothetical protein